MAVRAGLIAVEEEGRLAALRRYRILEQPPDGEFDRITALAARIFRVPYAVVSIVHEERVWFASHHGLDVHEIGRDPGLCASAILQHEPWIVTDAQTDPRTLSNPLVAGKLGVRFYAGVPLTTWDGHNLGTLCVLDQVPRQVASWEMDMLRDLAAIVMHNLELRRATQAVVAHEQEAQALSALAKSLEAAERERTRWARELHDETLQGLAALQMIVQSAVDDEDGAAGLSEVAELVQDEVVKLRHLISELRPAVLDQAGLAAAIESLARRLRVIDGLEVTLDLRLNSAERDLGGELESTVYRLVQEALTNVTKHAAATRVEIAVRESGRGLEVRVADDGVGFDTGSPGDGFGLIGMRERAMLVGGELSVDSAPGRGTRVRFVLGRH